MYWSISVRFSLLNRSISFREKASIQKMRYPLSEYVFFMEISCCVMRLPRGSY